MARRFTLPKNGHATRAWHLRFAGPDGIHHAAQANAQALPALRPSRRIFDQDRGSAENVE